MRPTRLLSRCLVAIALSAAACSSATAPDAASPEPADTTPSLELGTVPATVEGNVVTIPVNVENFTIVAADGDTSGATGHLHVFIDREPVAVGAAIPREPGIVHTTDNPIVLTGLTPGEHTFTVVGGDGLHQRIDGLIDEVTVDVKGPSVTAKAPATVKAGESFEIELAADGIEISEGHGEGKAHYHVLIDPENAPKPGDSLPAKEGKVIHTTESKVKIEGLEAGAHVIWVVAGDHKHEVVDPLAAARVAVTAE